MRALAALLVLLPLVFSARVFNPPFDLHALARQSTNDGVPKVPPQFNINSGGPEVGRFIAEAPEWILGDTSAFIDDDAIIGGAEEKNLPMYKSHRFGVSGATWGYNIPVMEPGIYGCTAHFAELHFEAFMSGKRVFNLHFATADGDVRTFDNIDVFDELGGAEFTVLTKTAENLVVTGILAIRLDALVGDPMLSGLTCERTGDLPPGVEPDFETDPRVPTAPVTDTDTDTDATMPDGGVAVSGTEVNINCGGEAVGRFSAEDFNWIRGTTSQWEGPPGVEIGGAEEKNRPAVKSHRYGQGGTDWGYVIPLENPGIYDCSLHFSETDSQSFTVGARVFDIMIMDNMLEDVDVYRDAGMAPFTAVVKTFTDLTISSDLKISFKAKTGNAYISAITCEKTGSLMMPKDAPDGVTESPDGDMTEEPSPPAIDPSLAPSPATPMESPMPTPVLVFPPGETPMIEPSEPIEPTPIASAISTMDDPEESTPPAIESPTATDPQETTIEPSLSPLSGATLDDPLELEEGSVLMEYQLRARVTNGVFTELIKDALITVSTDAVNVPSTFAMIGLEEEEFVRMVQRLINIVSRQDEDATKSYDVTLQARHTAQDSFITANEYAEFIDSGEVNNRLKARGVENVEIEFLGSQRITPAADVSNTSNTSTIVGATVGSVMAVLVVAALFAFFVVKRRSNEPSAAAFDAPPPAMTESEMSSVRERSETGASVEYLDDDSTFTAATSRAGDNHVDQVGFVKDVFGRGTADGAHGSS